MVLFVETIFIGILHIISGYLENFYFWIFIGIHYNQFMKNTITILGIISGVLVAISGLQSLFNYFILVRPFGDTLAVISMANWLASILISIVLLALGILIIKYTLLLRKTGDLKYAKLMMLFGVGILISTIYEFFALYRSQQVAVELIAQSFLISPLFWASTLALADGYFGISVYKINRRSGIL